LREMAGVFNDEEEQLKQSFSFSLPMGGTGLVAELAANSHSSQDESTHTHGWDARQTQGFRESAGSSQHFHALTSTTLTAVPQDTSENRLIFSRRCQFRRHGSAWVRAAD
jgi:hypothetical protein